VAQDVQIEAGAYTTLWSVVRSAFPGAERLGVVIDEYVERLHPLPPMDAQLASVAIVRVPRGEAAKTRRVLRDVQDALLPLRRHEPVVVVGGGATTDVGGFAAATLRRGLPWMAIPTTVIGMADASIGGKVAVNHPRGKNLLGAFHEASHVLIDPELLSTLDARDVRSGLAELYKVGRIGDRDLVAALAQGAPPLDKPRSWAALIRRAVDVKLELVAADLHDQGARRLLNYGHTLGHALERTEGNEQLRHGEAVAIGMEAAMQIALARGLVSEGVATAQTQALRALGLPTRLPAGVDPVRLDDALRLDKKRTARERSVWILPQGDHGVAVHDDVLSDEVLSAVNALRP
jgi:3-dehydroquinate synthase